VKSFLIGVGRRHGIPIPFDMRPPALDTFAADGLRIHFPTRTVEVDGRPIELTGTEYRLLCLLARNAGQVLRYETLLEGAWGSDCSTTDVLRFQVSRLRAKLEANPASQRYIFARPGVGYWFVGPADGPGREAIDSDQRRAGRRPARVLGMPGSPWELLAGRQTGWLAAA
jgi:DNA-binding winged helix-turn-helix (wHTH) protein